MLLLTEGLSKLRVEQNQARRVRHVEIHSPRRLSMKGANEACFHSLVRASAPIAKLVDKAGGHIFLTCVIRSATSV